MDVQRAAHNALVLCMAMRSAEPIKFLSGAAPPQHNPPITVQWQAGSAKLGASANGTESAPGSATRKTAAWHDVAFLCMQRAQIGVEVDRDWFVQKVVEGSPADLKGGVRVGDRVLRIDGQDCAKQACPLTPFSGEAGAWIEIELMSKKGGTYSIRLVREPCCHLTASSGMQRCGFPTGTNIAIAHLLNSKGAAEILCCTVTVRTSEDEVMMEGVSAAGQHGLSAGIWARAGAIPLRLLVFHLEANAQNTVLLTGIGIAGSIAACATLRLLKQAGEVFLPRVRCITFGQVPFHVPPELAAYRSQQAPQIDQQFISYILPSDTTPLKVSCLLTEVVDGSSGTVSEQVLQQRLSSIFLMHLRDEAGDLELSMMQKDILRSTATAITQHPQELQCRIGPLGIICSLFGQDAVGEGGGRVASMPWPDFANMQISDLKRRGEKVTPHAGETASTHHGVDYSGSFGPLLKNAMKQGSSHVSLKRLHLEPQLSDFEVLLRDEKDALLRLKGKNLTTISHISIETDSHLGAHCATFSYERCQNPDAWNSLVSDAQHHATHADLVVSWTMPVHAFRGSAKALLRIRVEGIMSDVREFLLHGKTLESGQCPDELDELQPEKVPWPLREKVDNNDPPACAGASSQPICHDQGHMLKSVFEAWSSEVWLPKPSAHLSRTPVKFSEDGPPQDERSQFQTTVLKLKSQLGQQEALVSLVREQNTAIQVLNETCYSCFLELSHVVDMGHTIDELNKRHDAAVDDAKQKSGCIQELTQERDKLVADLMQHHLAAREDSAAAQEEILLLKRRLAEVQERVKEAEAEVKGAQVAALAQHQSDLALLEQRLQEMDAAKAQADILHTNDVGRLQAKILERDERLHNAAAAHEEMLLLKRRLAAAQERVAEAEAEAKDANTAALAQHQSNLALLEQRLQESQTALGVAEAQAVGARAAALAEHQSELALLEQRLQESEAAKAQANSLHTQLQDEVERLRSSILERDEREARQKRDAASAAEVKDAPAQQFHASAQPFEQMNHLQTESSELRDQGGKQEKAAMLRKRLEAAEAEVQSQPDEEQSQLRDMEKEVWGAKMALDASVNELSENRRLMAGVEDSLRVHKAMLLESEKQVTAVSRQLALREIEVANLSKRLEECECMLVVTKTALLEAENKSLSCDTQPIAASLTIGRDFDYTMTDRKCAAEFERSLQQDISAAIGVDAASVIVLCHQRDQRGGIVTEIVLTGGDGAWTPWDKARELVDKVRAVRRGDLGVKEVGRFVKGAEVHGPIASTVCKVVLGAFAEQTTGGSEHASDQILTAIDEQLRTMEDTLEAHKIRIEVSEANQHQVRKAAAGGENRARYGADSWEYIMLQVIEATDRELDRELGLLSSTSEACKEADIPLLRRFEDGISTLEDIKAALPQLQEGLITRRRQIDLLKMSERDKSARIHALEATFERALHQMNHRNELMWINLSLRMLDRWHRAVRQAELRDDIRRNRAGELVAAEMIANADDKIDELSKICAEKTSENLKLLESSEKEASVMLRDQLASLVEQVQVLTLEKGDLVAEAAVTQLSLRDLQDQLTRKRLAEASAKGYMSSISAFIDGELMADADLAVETVQRASELCEKSLDELEAKLLTELAARTIVWERLDAREATAAEAVSGKDTAITAIKNWRQRACQWISSCRTRQILAERFLAWASWAYHHCLDRKRVRADHAFTRHNTIRRRKNFVSWRTVTIHKIRRVRLSNAVMDKAESRRLRMGLVALEKAARRRGSKAKALTACVVHLAWIHSETYARAAVKALHSWRRGVLNSQARKLVIQHYSLRVAAAYHEGNLAIARRSFTAWRGLMIATCYEQKEEAEMLASSVLACVEDTARSSDCAVQFIKVWHTPT